MSLAQQRAEAHLDVFKEQVDANLSCIFWISAANDFIRAATPVIQWEFLDSNKKQAIQKYREVQPHNNQALVNSLYVTTAAAFEEFCRLAIHSVCDEFNEGKRKLGEDEANLRNFLIAQTSRTLGRVHSPPAHFSFNPDELCSSIGSMVSGDNPVYVIGDAISDIRGILELEAVLKQITSLGKGISWQKLASDRDLRNALGTKKTRESETELKKLIATVSKNRNRIAHAGPSSSDVTEDILLKHAKALLAVGEAMVRAL